jgi:hypothetical protein
MRCARAPLRWRCKPGFTIEHIAKSRLCKEGVVAKALARRGDHPGLVHIISAMEACDAYQPWHDKTTHRTYVRPDSGKCLHYYFYFMDGEWGLIYLRVPTWAPFRLQFYCNGHSCGHADAANAPTNSRLFIIPSLSEHRLWV